MTFEEIQIMGSKYIFYSFTISQYPEILMLMEMISMKDSIYTESSIGEWDSLKSKTGTI
jgi:hypothetical protein